jgi:lipopolysaccharide heptosyltransferase II
MKFLVISLAGIGDTLFATPLIHELRANFPDSRIDVLVMWAGSKDLLAGNPHLNTIHHHNLISSGRADSFKFLLRLRGEKYDVSFNTHPQSRALYRAVARFIGARRRASHRYDNSGPLDALLVNRSLPQDYQRHAIDNNLDLLGLIGVKPVLPQHNYELFLSAAHRQWADEFMTAHELWQRPRLGIHVGSGGTKNLALRRWPLKYYVALIQRLAQSHPRTAVLLFGGPQEERDHEIITAQADRNQVFLARSQDLREAAALAGKCDAFLSVDTSLMHIAAAMRVPRQFVIETPTWNRLIEPYHNAFVLIRNPAVAGKNLDYYRYDGKGIQGTQEELTQCMSSVSVDDVHRIITRNL